MVQEITTESKSRHNNGQFADNPSLPIGGPYYYTKMDANSIPFVISTRNRFPILKKFYVNTNYFHLKANNKIVICYGN